MHGLLVNFKANPACKDSTEKLHQMYAVAENRAVMLIDEYGKYMTKEDTLNALYNYTFSGKEKRRHGSVKTKMTKAEKNWVLYDVGNSAFVLLVSTIMPIYFNYLAGNAGLSSVNYLAYWGYAASAATIIVALLGPVFGTLADTKGLKKPIFMATMLIGGIGCWRLDSPDNG